MAIIERTWVCDHCDEKVQDEYLPLNWIQKSGATPKHYCCENCLISEIKTKEEYEEYKNGAWMG